MRAWYLSIIAGGAVLERIVNYFWYELPVVFGQPANVVVTFGYFLSQQLRGSYTGPQRQPVDI